MSAASAARSPKGLSPREGAPRDRATIERLLLWLAAAMFATAAGAQPTPPAAQSEPAKSEPAKGDQPSLRDDREAIAAGKQWLERLDSGNTGPLWDNAANSLKGKVKRADWVAGLRDMRKPFGGKVNDRRAVKFARAHELPNAPSGDYAIIEFETDFANGKRASEQVIWYLESDGVWRVSGYFVR